MGIAILREIQLAKILMRGSDALVYGIVSNGFSKQVSNLMIFGDL